MNKCYALFFILLLSGCASSFTTAEILTRGSKPSGIKAYAITPAEALQIAHTAIVETFPGRKITAIKGGPWGYSTYTRVVLDTYNQQVLVKTFQGEKPDGKTARGIVFEVSGNGTSGSGRIRNGTFFEHLRSIADQTGSAIALLNAREVAFEIEGENKGRDRRSGPTERLAELKKALEEGLISQQEFESKRQEILRSM